MGLGGHFGPKPVISHPFKGNFASLTSAGKLFFLIWFYFNLDLTRPPSHLQFFFFFLSSDYSRLIVICNNQGLLLVTN